jgi:mRNA interferase RelE/StbE
MVYTVLMKQSARKTLSTLPQDAHDRIVLALALLRVTPRPPNALKLSGEDDLYRIRVGDYRIIYHIEDKRLVVLVVKIGNRRDVYR